MNKKSMAQLSIIFLMVIIIISIIALLSYVSAPDIPPIIISITRTADTETVCYDNNQCIINMFSEQVNYWNDSEYIPIDSTLIPYNQNGYDYKTKEGIYTLYVKQNSAWGDGVKYCVNNTGKEYCLTYQAQDYSFRDIYRSQDYMSSIVNKLGTIDNKTVRFNDIFVNVSLEYQTYNSMIKEKFTLKQKPRNPATYLNIPTLDFGAYIKYPGLEIYVNDTKKTSDFVTSSRIEFRINNTNTTVFYLPEPYALDSNYSKINLQYEVKTGNPMWFYVRTPYSWLNDSSRIYPVYIDPTTTIPYTNITENGYVDVGGGVGTACTGTITSLCSDFNGNEAGCNSHFSSGDGGPNGYYTCTYIAGPNICTANNVCGARKVTTDIFTESMGTVGYGKGYISWNTSLVPDSSTINEINFTFYFNSGGPTRNEAVNVTNMTGKKASDYPANGFGELSLYNNISLTYGDIGHITVVYDGDAVTGYGWKNITLSSVANTQMQNQLTNDFFMFGLYSDDALQYGYSIDPKTGTNKPFLTVTYTAGASDTIYPIFSNYLDNNASLVGSGTGWFNITINNTNGTVIFRINSTGTAYLATNLSANVYNISLTLTTGNYLYNWTAYGNGTSHNLNTSDNRYYTVNSTPPDILYPIFNSYAVSPDNNSQYNYPKVYQFNTTIRNSNGTAGIQFNGTNYTMSNISSVFNWSENDFFGAATYPYYFWSYGNGTSHFYNYSSVQYYTVAKNSSYALYLTVTNPITYGTTSDFTGSDNNLGDGGCTYALNISNQVYPAGNITANYSTAGCRNYTSASIINSVWINKAGIVLNLTIDGTYNNKTVTQGTQTNTTCVIMSGITQGNLNLTRNSTQVDYRNPANETITLPIGYWNYTCFYNQTQNYTANITTLFLNVTADTVYPIFSNYTDNSMTGIMGWFNVTVLNTNGTVFLEINNINYTSTNLTANVYNVSVFSLTPGTTYIYYWGSWGNGTNKNYNISGLRYYTVNAISSEISPGGGSSGAWIVSGDPISAGNETTITIAKKTPEKKVPLLLKEINEILNWIGSKISPSSPNIGIAVMFISISLLLSLTKLKGIKNTIKKWQKKDTNLYTSQEST